MPITWRQSGNNIQGSGTSVTVTLGSVPNKGNLLTAVWVGNSGSSNLVVKDGNGNLFTLSPKSAPFNFGGQYHYMAYLLTVPGNPSSSIIFSWTGTTGTDVGVAEFIPDANCIFQFDQDATASGASQTTISTPVITPTFTNSMIYAVASIFSHNITAPTLSGTFQGWTGGPAYLGGNTGVLDEWVLNTTGATAVAYTQSPANSFVATAMCFYEVGIDQGYGAAVIDDQVWMGGDDN